MYFRSAILLNLTLLVLTAASACPGFADEQTVPANQQLKNEQEAISGRFARFERVLSQMADMLGYEDPERAELLRRAISLGREQGISSSLETIAKDLGRSEFGSAVEKQKAVTANLKSLLKLLQSEDRMSSVERERERINNLLKDVNNVLLEERAARARAQNSEAPSSASPAQQEALKKTDKILDDIQKHDSPGESRSQSESEAGDSADGKPSEENSGKPKAGQKEMDAEGQKAGDKETESQESDKPGESDRTDKAAKGEPDKSGSENKSPEEKQSSEESSEGNPADDQPSQSESQSQGQSQSESQGQSGDKPEDKEPEEQTKGKKNLDSARNMMQEALDLLKQQKKEQAVDRQDKAITELQQAANELEKMLNQLREEEKEMVLAALEARFQRLLAMQTQIMESTMDLASTPRKEWLDNAVSACRALGQQQTELTRECSYTTSLLREDGTSVSILVAVEDIESDMGKIAERLQQTKADPLTKSMEADVIEALKELVETTQKEMSEMKQQQQQPPSGQQDKPDLVDLMQEIKVLRSLQLRVNRRTRQVNELFQDVAPSDVADLQEQLFELANRQQRLGDSAAALARKMEERQ